LKLEEYLGERRALVEAALLARVERRWVDVPARLAEAMRYSLFAGGKRLRPILALAAAEAVGGRPLGAALEFACALEMVHTYSLIHDDLPCMDDDDLRRGRPTSHKVFGEGLAVLAGDGLLTEAFGFVTEVGGPVGAALAHELASGAGAAGMVGGQLLDLDATDSKETVGAAQVERIHRAKTAALIGASTAGGAIAAEAKAEVVASMREYGIALGLAFQAADDWLDVEASEQARGKRAGGDAELKKATLVSELGVEGAKRRAKEHADRAVGLIAHLPGPEWLMALARYAMERPT
jgi:geranylgeranyl diphosphate synthase type II